jgi:hypothetical protein
VALVIAALGLAGCKLGLDYGDSFTPCEGAACDAGSADDAAPEADADEAPTESAYATAVLADQPVLFLRFDEASGAVALDASGNQRDGVLSGGAVRQGGAFAGSAGSLFFDGVDDLVTVPDDEALRLDGDFSIELWVRLDASVTGTYPGLLTKGNATTKAYLLFYPAMGRILALKRANLTAADFGDGTPLTAASYSHMVVTYDATATQVRWYKDGLLVHIVDDVLYPTNDDASDLRIGRGDEPGRDSIDEVALYPTALSPDRVLAHYDAAAGGTPN